MAELTKRIITTREGYDVYRGDTLLEHAVETTIGFDVYGESPGAEGIESVNGQFGPSVVLDAGDVGAIATVNNKTGPTVNLTASDVGAIGTVNGKSGAVVNLTPADVQAVPVADKGVANGVATLGPAGKVPNAQLPALGIDYLGAWNATTNTPALSNATGVADTFYLVSVAGTQNLGAGAIEFFEGDLVLFENGAWHRVGRPDAVTSVNAKLGAVVLNAADVGAVPTSPAANVIYATAGAGVQTTLPHETGPSAGAVVVRDSAGRTQVAAPAAAADVATKGYVDTADATKLPLAGGTLTGLLDIVIAADGPKAILAKKLPGTQNDAPSALGEPSSYLHLGGGEWGLNSYRLLGLGYKAAPTDHPPAAFGYQETQTAGNTKGDLILAVRPTNTNVAPATILRVRSDGQVLFDSSAYVPSTPESVPDKKYVDAQVVSKANAADLTAHTSQTGAGTHLPPGGTPGQIPVKGAGAAVAWADAPSGGGGGGVPTTNQSSRVYVTTPSGEQSQIPYSNTEAEGNAMAQYTEDGELFVSTPTDPTHAASKGYVDSAIAAGGVQTPQIIQGAPTETVLDDNTPLTVVVNASLGSQIVTLDFGIAAGKRITITRIDNGHPTFSVAVNPDGGSINGSQTAVTLDEQWTVRDFIKVDSSDWVMKPAS